MQINTTGQSLDSFAVITVASTAGFQVGELVTGGTSNATAKVSGLFSATELLVKAVKGTFGAETITGNKSSTSSAASAFAWGKKLKRQGGSGATVSVVRDVALVTDSGLEVLDVKGRPEVKTSVRMGASKIQTPAADAAAVPVFKVKKLPAAKTFSVAKGDKLRLTLSVNEAVTVTGVPQVEVVLAGTSGSRQLSYVASASSAKELVFEYGLVAGDATGNLGQIVSIANTWTNNGGAIKDKKSDGTDSAALTPSTFTVGSVTGIVVGA